MRILAFGFEENGIEPGDLLAHDHHIDGSSTQRVERLAGRFNQVDRSTTPAQQQSDQIAVCVRTVEDEKSAPAKIRTIGGETLRARRSFLQRDEEPEPRSPSRLALYANASAEQLYQAFGNHESQSSAARPACRGCIDLLERLEQLVDRFERDPDSGVLDREANPDFGLGLSSQLTSNDYGPGFSELDPVVSEIEQNLSKPPGVSVDSLFHLRVQIAGKAEILFIRPEREQIRSFFDELLETEVDGVEFHVASFDLGEIEDVADDLEQRIGGKCDRLGVFPLLFRKRCIQKQPRQADHGIHRCSDFVAHRGEEFALGSTCGFGRFLRFFGSLASREQLAVGSLDLVFDGDVEGDILDDRGATLYDVLLIVDGRDRDVVDTPRRAEPNHPDLQGSRFLPRFAEASAYQHPEVGLVGLGLFS